MKRGQTMKIKKTDYYHYLPREEQRAIRKKPIHELGFATYALWKLRYGKINYGQYMEECLKYEKAFQESWRNLQKG